MLDYLTARIPAHYWILLLLLWGGLVLLTLRFDAYGLDENAAQALLLNWSIAGDVANPIVVFGAPDFRALLYIPLGIYWPGSVVAAKVFTVLIGFAAVLLFYRWSARQLTAEVALISSGLLLIAPFMLHQIDSLGAGVYLLFVFGAGVWLDDTYCATPRPLGGKYFLQLLLAAIAVTLHPAGLAYPAALVWRWYQQPVDTRQQRHIYTGVALAVLFALLLRQGWKNLAWWSSPIETLAGALGVYSPWLGWVAGALLILAVLAGLRRLMSDFMGQMLLAALALGAFAADAVWATLALTLVLYYGSAQLIALNQKWRGGFLAQRGLTLLAIMLISLLFMSANKQHYAFNKAGALSPEDRLIARLVEEARDTERPFRAASQWPARTMLATRRAALPLPPPAQDAEAFLKQIQGVTHLIFNPYQVDKALARNLAETSSEMETVARESGGVILRVRAQ
ncbi:MAG: hypothetical protein M1527_01170 [Gammaproteobacteria bacterium]|nr:hypothetical protein [Gammaproteobacteria bacterium]